MFGLVGGWGARAHRPVPAMVAALLTAVLTAACNSTPPPLQAAVYAGPNKDHKLTPGHVNQTSNGADSPDAAANIATPTAEAPVGPVPRFDVVAQRANDRPDEMTTYYVVIDPVDPTYDGFKGAVKHVLIALRDNNGGPVFSARIWDHLPAAQTEVSYRSNPDLFSDDMLAAKESFNGRHLIANYVGGLASVDEPPAYVVFWYPEAGVENQSPESPPPNQWMSAELWKP